MFKNIKILKKSDFSSKKFNTVDMRKDGDFTGLIPIGTNEVNTYSSCMPVLISGGENNEFVIFSGLNNKTNIFKQNISLPIPSFMKNYPFLMINAKDENDKIVSVIAIDDNKEFVGSKKKEDIFDREKELTQTSQKIIDNVRELHKQRDLSKLITRELKERDLLQKQDFKIKINGKEQNVLTDYYIINREKLMKLDDNTLATWAKKGWMGIIDAHLYSIRNFQKLVDLLQE